MPASILTVVFENHYLQAYDIPQWRRVVNDVVGWQEPLLHNHTPEGGETHAYPLVQFRAVRGRGALVGVGAGAEVLLRIMPLLQTELGKIQLELDQAAMQEGQTGFFQYALYRWLALSPINYAEWRQTRSLRLHVAHLERILTGQLLGLLKTLQLEPLPKVVVEIEHLDELGHFSIPTDKGEVQHLAFDVKFSCNVAVPQHQLGIGKFSSKGYGILEMQMKPQYHGSPQQNQKDKKTR
ncbi:CRISPR-associated endonuclease Cas6 [Runella zeae]|uniref:CRISPR-associated endonuclease Cas6 n=1 Tax=Runella zeae TaxID=94255 RepID=UPI000411071B|nr:CRISPR-associated endonuclease Cas6 [Runella zeae]